VTATDFRGDGAAGDLVSAPQLVRRVLVTLRRRWLTALALFSLTLAAALAVTFAKPARYSATAQILLAPSDAVGQLVSPGTLPSPANAQRDVDTNAKLITSHPVLELVRARLRSRASDEELAAKVEVSGQTESSLVSITATDASLAAARRLATALALQYGSFRRSSAQSAVRQAIAAGRQRLEELRRIGAPSDDRAALRARLAELETNAAVTTGGVQFVHLPGGEAADASAGATLQDAAARSDVVASPVAAQDNLTPRKLVLTLMLAAFAGGLLAVAGAFAVEAKDRRLLHVDDVAAAFGVPVLGCLPGPGAGRARERSVVDAYADLTASLGLATAGGPRTLMLSPVGSATSAWAVACGMAAQLAALRRRAMVVDADLAAAAASALDGGPSCGGLAEVLAGKRALADELAVVHIVGPSADLHREPAGEVLSYELLPAGDAVSNPAALLGRPVLPAILRDALARAEVVLLSAGAPVPVSQSAPLAMLSDRIVLVVALRRTTDVQAAAARRALGPLYDRVAGVVVELSERRGPGSRELPVAVVAVPEPERPTDAATSNGIRRSNGVRPPVAPAGREHEHV
jgi:capsular polysaccharide biosynthesis protein